MAWPVADIDTVVAELRQRGVVFEQVEVPGLRIVDGIAEVAGNYPSAGGGGERAAWFRDSESNLHGTARRSRGHDTLTGTKPNLLDLEGQICS